MALEDGLFRLWRLWKEQIITRCSSIILVLMKTCKNHKIKKLAGTQAGPTFFGSFTERSGTDLLKGQQSRHPEGICLSKLDQHSWKDCCRLQALLIGCPGDILSPSKDNVSWRSIRKHQGRPACQCPLCPKRAPIQHKNGVYWLWRLIFVFYLLLMPQQKLKQATMCLTYGY